ARMFNPHEVARHEAITIFSCVEEGGENERDVIFGIYEGTDHNGHDTGFGNDNYNYIKGFRDQDARCYELLQAIYSRPSFENEDRSEEHTSNSSHVSISYAV